jgi:hypothetical protein
MIFEIDLKRFSEFVDWDYDECRSITSRGKAYGFVSISRANKFAIYFLAEAMYRASIDFDKAPS